MSAVKKPGLEKSSFASRLNKLDIKLKQIKKKKFGINKGVQHAIRYVNAFCLVFRRLTRKISLENL